MCFNESNAISHSPLGERRRVGKSVLHRKKNECAEHEKVMKKMRK